MSALTRVPAGTLATERLSRDLIIRSARRLADVPVREIADRLELGLTTVYRVLDAPDSRLDVVRRVIGDPRFALLDDGDLRGTPAWRQYRDRR